MSRDFHVVFLMMTSCDLTVTLTCTYFKHNTLLDCSPAVKKRFGEFGRSTVDSPVSMGNNPKTHISDL